ncbi:MAG: hypothetical protein CFE29_03735 [Bradyrhizobiaceae bacterium PARB1]|jgi:hypothetical protein|nr:MAG: hypothetical protein CFE29_03735 [Bradyrhizobiaceae bacterium PARB1]
MTKAFAPIALRDDTGTMIHTVDSLSAALGHALDTDAFNEIDRAGLCASAAGMSIRTAGAAARARYERHRSRENLWRWIASHGPGRINGRHEVVIWSSEREQFRLLVVVCRRTGGGCADIVEDRALSTGELMAYREAEPAGYPHNMMTDQEALAAQRATGVEDDYVPLGKLLSQMFERRRERETAA